MVYEPISHLSKFQHVLRNLPFSRPSNSNDLHIQSCFRPFAYIGLQAAYESGADYSLGKGSSTAEEILRSVGSILHPVTFAPVEEG